MPSIGLDFDLEHEEPDTGPSAEDIPVSSPARRIGEEAEMLDREGTVGDRIRLPDEARRRFAVLGLIYIAIVLLLAAGTLQVHPLTTGVLVSLSAFALETADSSAGMGMGTGLAPLLFVFGFEPLEVVPTLLVSQMLVGVAAGLVHDDMGNVDFGVRPANTETRLLGLLVGFGGLAMVVSVLGTYVVFDVPPSVIKTFVSVLVILMGAVGVLRAHLKTRIAYRRGRLTGFVLLAGLSKGIGAGGFGPIMTLGQILSGVYEKSAVAITTMAEGLISGVGVVVFLLVAQLGVLVDLSLFPWIFGGAFLAALVGPYLVRVVPNALWRYVIPVYAVVIGIAGVVLGVGV